MHKGICKLSSCTWYSPSNQITGITDSLAQQPCSFSQGCLSAYSTVKGSFGSLISSFWTKSRHSGDSFFQMTWSNLTFLSTTIFLISSNDALQLVSRGWSPLSRP